MSLKCGKLLNLAGTLTKHVTFEVSNCTKIPLFCFGKAITIPVYSPFKDIYFLIFLKGLSSILEKGASLDWNLKEKNKEDEIVLI